MEENSVENPYIKNLLGVLTRAFFIESDMKLTPRWRKLYGIYQRNKDYFSNNSLRRSGDETGPINAETMIGVLRLVNVVNLLTDCFKNGIEGDLVETGVWRGGCCILMNGITQEYSENHRKIHLFDSFEGLPAPYIKEDTGDTYHQLEWLKVSVDEVKSNFEKYGLLTDNLVFHKGFFKDSMKNVDDITKIAVLRLDGDMYCSTMEVLEGLYDKVTPGGFVIIDDWSYASARNALTDFISKRGEQMPRMIDIDIHGAYFKKDK
jgi:O-methyltransferase